MGNSVHRLEIPELAENNTAWRKRSGRCWIAGWEEVDAGTAAAAEAGAEGRRVRAAEAPLIKDDG